MQSHSASPGAGSRRAAPDSRCGFLADTTTGPPAHPQLHPPRVWNCQVEITSTGSPPSPVTPRTASPCHSQAQARSRRDRPSPGLLLVLSASGRSARARHSAGAEQRKRSPGEAAAWDFADRLGGRERSLINRTHQLLFSCSF